MNPLNYIVSIYGLGIVVGITGDKQKAEEFAVGAENVFGWHHSDDLFDHLLHCPSEKDFRKYLILREYYQIWDEFWSKNNVSGRRDKANIYQFTKRAIKRAKLIMESSVKHENFMLGMSARNNEYRLGEF